MTEFYEYEDAELKVRVPEYLRIKKILHYFEPHRKKDENREISSIGIHLENDEGAEIMRSNLMSLKDYDWQGVECRHIRRGPSSYVTNGLEGLSRNYDTATKEVRFDYEIVFDSNGRYVHVRVTGRDDLEKFEAALREIITSIEVKPVSPQTERSPTSSTNESFNHGGGLPAKDKAQLTRALESLPDELKYLHDPILAIADQDPELLGCGEADVTLLDEALQGQAASHSPGFAAAHAEQLEQWLNSISTPEDAATWAGPVWFVAAFLKGYDMFSEE